jgi:DNA processing protein
VGNVLAKNLLAYCGSAQNVFKQSKSKLLKIPGIGETIATNILAFTDFSKAEDEIAFIAKHKIRPLYFTDADYPETLKQIADSPLMLYRLGNMELETHRMVAIVGTRKASDEGKEFCEQLVAGLKPYNCTIVSGLAYGIDIAAHKAALQNNMPTIGVLAHGLDRVYPAVHTSTAKKMIENGGLLTEYMTGTVPDRENFPSRNRIVAGLCDAVVVIETDIKGGSMITAEIAFGYNRDVFAVPGNPNNENRKGCNFLIKNNKAALIENADDIALMMGWDAKTTAKPTPQHQLLLDLTKDEEKVVQALKTLKNTGMDEIAFTTKLSINETALVLLELELKGAVKSLPGKIYKLV